MRASAFVAWSRLGGQRVAHARFVFPRVVGPMYLLPLLFGCVMTSTDVTSMRSPDFNAHNYTRIGVHVDLVDLDLRKSTEAKLCQDLSLCKVTAFPMIELIFPGDEPTPEKLAQVIAENRLEAILLVTPGDSGTTSSYVPPTYHTTSTAYATATGSGVCGYGQSTSYPIGGYTINKPWAKFEMRLFDAPTGKVAWIATASSRGNGHARSRDLLTSVSSKGVRQLSADGMIPAVPAVEHPARETQDP